MLRTLYEIGKNVATKQEEIDKYIIPVEIKKNKNNEEIKTYIVKVIFDVHNIRILFDCEEYEPGKNKKYNYLQTPVGNSNQFPIIRDKKHLKKIFFGSMFSNIKNEIIRFDYKNNGQICNPYKKLKFYINSIYESQLYMNQDQKDKDKNQVKFSYIEINDNDFKKFKKAEFNKLFSFDNSEKNENKNKPEIEKDLIKKYLFNNSKNIRIAFYVPVIRIKNNKDSIEDICLSSLPEYRDMYLATKKTFQDSTENDAGENLICHICGDKKNNIIKELSFRTFGAKISQIFTITTINSSAKITGDYSQNYNICEDCKNILVTGERYIDKELKFRLAGKDTYLIPNLYTVKGNFPYNRILSIIKHDSELLFNTDEKYGLMKIYKKIKTQINNISDEDKIWSDNIFDITFFTYESDGKSFKAINIIDNISKFNIEKITKTILIEYEKLQDRVYGFNLNRFYSIIPIKKDSTKKNEILEFYNNLFKMNKINKRIIYGYFSQAINYLYYLKPDNFYKKQDIYSNLYKSAKMDFNGHIENYIFNYLILINSFRNLNLFFEEDTYMGDTTKGDVFENFLNTQKFNEQQRALFYLGALIKRVAKAQKGQKHYSVPVLQKIQFQGMRVRDIQRLYLEIMEKIRQYSKQILEYKDSSEEVDILMNLYHLYFDKHIDTWNLSDEENVFYILSGYAYK